MMSRGAVPTEVQSLAIKENRGLRNSRFAPGVSVMHSGVIFRNAPPLTMCRIRFPWAKPRAMSFEGAALLE